MTATSMSTAGRCRFTCPVCRREWNIRATKLLLADGYMCNRGCQKRMPGAFTRSPRRP